MNIAVLHIIKHVSKSESEFCWKPSFIYVTTHPLTAMQCNANQLTDFYMMGTLVVNGLKKIR